MSVSSSEELSDSETVHLKTTQPKKPDSVTSDASTAHSAATPESKRSFTTFRYNEPLSKKDRYRNSTHAFTALWVAFYAGLILEATGAIILGNTIIPNNVSRNKRIWGLGGKASTSSLRYMEWGTYIWEDWTDWSWNGWKKMGDGNPMYTRTDMFWHGVSACLSGVIYLTSNAAYNKLKMQTRTVKYIALAVGCSVNFTLMLVVIFELKVNLLINCGFVFCEYWGDTTYEAMGWNPAYGACFAAINLFYGLRALKWLAWEILYHKKIPAPKIRYDVESPLNRSAFNGYSPREPAANKIQNMTGAKTTCILFWIWIFIWYFGTLTIPSIWEYYTPKLQIKASNNFRDPESVSWKGSWNAIMYTTHRDCDIYGPAEPDPSRERRSCDSNDRFVLNFYFDQLIHFIWMFCMMTSGTTYRFNKAVRHHMNTRIWIGTHQITMKAIINGSLTCVYVILTLVYWTGVHDWKKAYQNGKYDPAIWPPVNIETLDDGTEVIHPDYGYWFRVTGMWACIFLSFAMYPISRNNLISDIIGISDTVVLFIHKWSGRTFLICMLLHIIFVGLYSMVKYHNFYDVLPVLYGQIHSDHYGNLPSFKLLCYVAAFVLGIMSLSKLRKYRYQFFLVTHVGIGLPLTIATIYHANSGWYYLVPPISLYFWKAIWGDSRLRKNWIVQDLRIFTKDGEDLSHDTPLHKGNVVHLTVITERHEDETTFNPGCYTFLSDGSISAHRKQPFTVASAASRDSVTFVFEVTGNGRGWTHRFCEQNYHHFKGRMDEDEAFKRASISIDGPYNNHAVSHWLQRSSGAVFVAAGLGLTAALASILSLAYDAKETPRYFTVKYVQMILSVRAGTAFEQYVHDSMIPAIERAYSGNNDNELRIQLDIFVTGSPYDGKSLLLQSLRDETSGIKLNLHEGRIAWDKAYLMEGLRSKKSMMHICGNGKFTKMAKRYGKDLEFGAVLKESFSF